MKILHVIVTDKNHQTIRPLNDGTGNWENGEWELAEQTANDLVADGRIMMHANQSAGARHGGRVVGYTTRIGIRVDEETGEERECLFYTLQYEPMDELQGVKFKGGWSQKLAVEVV